MTAAIIDGKAYAAKLRGDIAAAVATMPRPPGLAVVLVGDDPASAVYVRSKGKQTVEVGIDRKSTRLNSSHVSQSRMPSSA